MFVAKISSFQPTLTSKKSIVPSTRVWRLLREGLYSRISEPHPARTAKMRPLRTEFAHKTIECYIVYALDEQRLLDVQEGRGDGHPERNSPLESWSRPSSLPASERNEATLEIESLSIEPRKRSARSS